MASFDIVQNSVMYRDKLVNTRGLLEEILLFLFRFLIPCTVLGLRGHRFGGVMVHSDNHRRKPTRAHNGEKLKTMATQ